MSLNKFLEKLPKVLQDKSKFGLKVSKKKAFEPSDKIKMKLGIKE